MPTPGCWRRAMLIAWASPKAPGIMFKSLFNDDQALRLKLSADPRLWRWVWLFLKQCTSERARLQYHSQAGIVCLLPPGITRSGAATPRVEYDGLNGGNLYFYRTPESFEKGVEHTGILRDQGLEMQVLERDRVAELEPALAPHKNSIAGAVFTPGDCQWRCTHVFPRPGGLLCRDAYR